MSDILITMDLHKTYENGPQRIEVIKGINLNMRRGEVIVMIGPSGVGKSTLLHLVGGLDKPTRGQVIIDDQDIFAISDRERAYFRNKSIGFVFQFHHLLPEFTALENVMLPGMMYRSDLSQVEKSASTLLSEVGLSHRLDHKPSQLSGGEQQRVAVARALINEPQMILADEPTGNLDKQNSEALYNLILDLNTKLNQTFIIVTHNDMMASRANRVIELDDGRIKKDNRLSS
jgi:lipoprotein-releasing system ATP-binding protein